MPIDLDSHQTSAFSEETIDCRTVFCRMTPLMRAFSPRTPTQISNVQRKCAELPHEHGQQTIVEADFSELSGHDIEYHSTFMKGNSFSFGDSLTWVPDAFMAPELLSYPQLEVLG